MHIVYCSRMIMITSLCIHSSVVLTIRVHIMQVGIDLIGPLPLTTRGNKYIVTLVDYFSKWPEAAPLPNKTAEGVALFLFDLFCRYVFYCNNIANSFEV